MRSFPLILAAAVLLSQCASPPPPQAPHFYRLPGQPVPAVPPDLPAEAPAAVVHEAAGIRLEGVSFDSRSHQLRVVDQTAGPGTEFSGPEAAAIAHSGLAACNGGFYTPEGQPLGLVVTQGVTRGYWNTASSLGSGIFAETRSGKTRLLRRDDIDAEEAMEMQELLQSGPTLIHDGRKTKGLKSSPPRRRTLIAWDGAHHWWLGTSSACSLDELTATLAKSPPCPWTVKQALNLDGGTSSTLWIDGSVSGGPLLSRGLLQKPARNYLVLVPR